jgi:hypothetical protein
MGRFSFLLACFLVMGLAGTVDARRSDPADLNLQPEVQKGFEQVLDLWRDGKYEELYERSFGGKESREHFRERLSSAPRRPACCWEKLQELKLISGGEGKVTVRARVGLEGGGNGESVTRSFRFVKEDGVWKIARQDILSLSGSSKKKKRHVKWD